MFVITVDGCMLCSVCRREIPHGQSPYQCTACAVSQSPTPRVRLLQKAANFAASAARHIAAGAPQASEEQVARRFAICQTCEHFDGKACRQCGCPVVREKKFLSKLSWANEKCPVGKWGPEAEKQPPDGHKPL